MVKRSSSKKINSRRVLRKKLTHCVDIAFVHLNWDLAMSLAVTLLFAINVWC